MNAILSLAPPAYNPRRDHGWGELAVAYAECIGDMQEAELARRIGVEVKTLRALSVGWSRADRAFSLPLQTAAGTTCGLLLWNLDGRSKVQGRPRLVLPEARTEFGDRLLVAVDVCDALALYDAGFVAVGVSGVAAAAHLVELAERREPAAVVLVAWAAPVSRSAAESLATILRPYGTACRIVVPPGQHQTFAAWRRTGANAGAIVERIGAAEFLVAVGRRFSREVA